MLNVKWPKTITNEELRNATKQIQMRQNSTYPDAGYPVRQLSGSAWPFVLFVENSTTLTCLEITGYRIKYGTVLWFLELQIRRGRNV